MNGYLKGFTPITVSMNTMGLGMFFKIYYHNIPFTRYKAIAKSPSHKIFMKIKS